jgi:drug/metabolite transporter (DMT)-like permease
VFNVSEEPMMESRFRRTMWLVGVVSAVAVAGLAVPDIAVACGNAMAHANKSFLTMTGPFWYLATILGGIVVAIDVLRPGDGLESWQQISVMAGLLFVATILGFVSYQTQPEPPPPGHIQ